jgi:hypothetical protein
MRERVQGLGEGVLRSVKLSVETPEPTSSSVIVSINQVCKNTLIRVFLMYILLYVYFLYRGGFFGKKRDVLKTMRLSAIIVTGALQKACNTL